MKDRPQYSVAPIPAVAAPIGELVRAIDLPESTYRSEEAAGRGCRTFFIGRRKYALLTDWENWLTSLAESAEGSQ